MCICQVMLLLLIVNLQEKRDERLMENLTKDPLDIPSLKSKVDLPKTSLLTNDPEKLKKMVS